MASPVSAFKKASRTTELDDDTKTVLAEVLGLAPLQLPEVESDSEALQFLSLFAEHIQIQSKIAEAQMRIASPRKREYRHEEARLQEQLKLIGITRDGLSRTAQSHLSLIVHVAEKLQLHQPRFNAILCKWSDLYLQRYLIQDREDAVKNAALMSQRMAQKMKETKARVQAIYEECQKRAPSQLSLPPNAESKIQQYRQDTEHYKTTLVHRGYTPEVIPHLPSFFHVDIQVAHEAIAKEAYRLESLQSETTQLKKELSRYDTHLPRDLAAAQRALEELQSQRDHVTDAIRRKMIS